MCKPNKSKEFLWVTGLEEAVSYDTHSYICIVIAEKCTTAHISEYRTFVLCMIYSKKNKPFQLIINQLTVFAKKFFYYYM